MVKKAAIICEYNPLHNGHEAQMREIRARLGADTAIICLMSGSFVQRGEPALFHKYVRAEAASLAGADVVLELPVTCVLRSAEGFADGAVSILSRLGGIDYLAFGCECGDAAGIACTAERTLAKDYRIALKGALAQGISYAAARELAMGEFGEYLKSPNDILAVEYCAALLRRQCGMTPLALPRAGDDRARTVNPESPSATALRTLSTKELSAFVPDAAATLYEGAARHTLEQGERAILARLRGMPESQWENIAHGSEGLYRKMRKAALSAGSVAEVLHASASKRYPRTRLLRLLQCAFLCLSTQELQYPIPYCRVLSFRESGRPILRAFRDDGAIPLITASETPRDRIYHDLETRVEALYALYSEAGVRPLSGERVRRILP